MNLHWITGFIDSTQERLFDNDLVGGMDAVTRTNTYEGQSYSTELRLEQTGDAFDWVVGFLYADDEQTQENNVAVGSNPTATINGVGVLPPFPAGLGLALNMKSYEVQSIAAFADFTWHATDTMDVIFGGRYTSDDVDNSVTSFAPSTRAAAW